MKKTIVISLCLAVGAGVISVRAEDNAAQAAAREALMQKFYELDHTQTPAATESNTASKAAAPVNESATNAVKIASKEIITSPTVSTATDPAIVPVNAASNSTTNALAEAAPAAVTPAAVVSAESIPTAEASTGIAPDTTVPAAATVAPTEPVPAVAMPVVVAPTAVPTESAPVVTAPAVTAPAEPASVVPAKPAPAIVIPAAPVAATPAESAPAVVTPAPVARVAAATPAKAPAPAAPAASKPAPAVLVLKAATPAPKVNHGQEIITTTGAVYRNAQVEKVTADGIIISYTHEQGGLAMARIPFGQLSGDLQAKYRK